MDEKVIGGYFELELSKNNNFFESNIGLNSGRNCFEYIILCNNYSKVYIPYYTCDVLLEPLIKLNVPYEFYDVDFNLNPIFDFSTLKSSDGFLYTNYFGLKDNTVAFLSLKISTNLIVDNAQALFAEPLKDIPTFYSPRKFVGVPDGGFVTNIKQNISSYTKDISYQRISHLIKRIDLSAESGYSDFQINDKSLVEQPIKLMSDLTKNLINNINLENVREQRKKNFNFLHNNLKDKNLLNIAITRENVPMIYPFRTKDLDLKERLISNKIYCATYWPNVLNWCNVDKNAYTLTQEIIALPIDQRYSSDDLKKILKYV